MQRMELHSRARSRRAATHLFPARLGPGGDAGAALPVRFQVAVEMSGPKALPPILSGESCVSLAVDTSGSGWLASAGAAAPGSASK